MTWSPLADDHSSDPRPVQESLDAFARRLGIAHSQALAALFSRWSLVVGETVAAHAQPRSLVSGTLLVEVDHPGWATELRYLVPHLLVRLTELIGAPEVERIEVRVRA